MERPRDVSTDLSSSTDVESRKRASKACDRCKLKKVKCCGSIPCTRCQADDTVCRFSSKTKDDVKPASATRASQLERQHAILTKALRTLWQRYPETLSSAQGSTQGRKPSIHEIIRTLGLLDDAPKSLRWQSTLETIEDEENMIDSRGEDNSQRSSAISPGSTETGSWNTISVDPSVDYSQRDQQTLQSFENNMSSSDMDDQQFQFPDLDDYAMNNLAQYAVPEMLGTIANRRGLGNMPSLGHLPSYIVPENTMKSSLTLPGNSRCGQQHVNGVDTWRFDSQDVPQTQQAATSYQQDDILFQFTNVTPATPADLPRWGGQ